MLERERDLMAREGKPPGCCDKPNCPWKHINDPPESTPRAGAAEQSSSDPGRWPVCKHVVDPTTYGRCYSKDCEKSHCELAAAFVRKQIFPNSRNSGPGTGGRRQTPERNRQGSRPRTERRTPSRVR